MAKVVNFSNNGLWATFKNEVDGLQIDIDNCVFNGKVEKKDKFIYFTLCLISKKKKLTFGTKIIDIKSFEKNFFVIVISNKNYKRLKFFLFKNL